MNTAKLSRATVVLARETHQDLAYVARRMGVTRSALVRDVMAEPIALMAKWVRAVPETVKPEDLAKLQALMEADITDLVERKSQGLEAGNA